MSGKRLKDYANAEIRVAAGILCLMLLASCGTSPSRKTPGKEALTLYRQGYDWTERKKYDLALSSFTKALEREPDYSDACMARGIVHYRLKNYARALADMEIGRAHV